MNYTNHFNALSEAEQERLVIVAEECGEVIQAICKVLRHGYDSNNKGKLPETNRQQLSREVADLQHAILRLQSNGDIDRLNLEVYARLREGYVQQYLHHQPKSLESPEAPKPGTQGGQ